MRFNEEFGGTRTICVWLETWKLGEPLICSDVDLGEWILMKKLGFFYPPLIHDGMV